MAITRYIDTNAPAGGDGSEGNPWNGIQAIWGSLPADDVTLICTGGEDIITSTLNNNNSPALSITVIGNWSGFDLNESCYRIKSVGFEIVIVGRRSVTFRNVILENSKAIPGQGSRSVTVYEGELRLEECGVIWRYSGDSTYYCYGIGAYTLGGSPSLYMRNCIAFGKDFDLPINDNSRLFTSNVNVPTKISNSIFFVVNQIFPTVAGGSVNFGAEPKIDNCIVAGHINAATITNCVSVSYGSVNETNCQTVPYTTQLEFWEDPNNGNFTPVATPPSFLLDAGIDNSVRMGSSIDILGNDRNAPQAGAAWDIGHYEWGFASSPPVGAPGKGTGLGLNLSLRI